MQVSNDESWLFSSIVAWFYFSICVQLRGCKNDIIKVLLFSKILISPSRAEFRFHRRACVCDADTWLGKCFKLILNSFPLMSIHRCAVSRLCGIWGWQSHKRYFWLRQSNNIRLRQWREKSMHCRPIASINWLRMMERSSKWSQKKKIISFCEINDDRCSMTFGCGNYLLSSLFQKKSFVCPCLLVLSVRFRASSK